jgi:hypothetical protein
MKIEQNPTVCLTKKEVEVLKNIHQMFKDMPCHSIKCTQCPFTSLCDYKMDTDEQFVQAVKKQLTESIM